MTREETLKAILELRKTAGGYIMLQMSPPAHLIQQCKICNMFECMEMEVSDEGDQKLFQFLKDFQDKHFSCRKEN